MQREYGRITIQISIMIRELYAVTVCKVHPTWLQRRTWIGEMAVVIRILLFRRHYPLSPVHFAIILCRFFIKCPIRFTIQIISSPHIRSRMGIVIVSHKYRLAKQLFGFFMYKSTSTISFRTGRSTGILYGPAITFYIRIGR